MTTIPPEAIEAAKRAYFDAYTMRDGEAVRLALEAALPHIKKAVRADERKRIAKWLRANATAIRDGAVVTSDERAGSEVMLDIAKILEATDDH